MSKVVHRSIGRLQKRTEDSASVGFVVQQILLTDDFLDKLLLNIKACRDAWSDIITYQCGISQIYVTVYEPIPGPNGEERHLSVETPPEIMERTERFSAYIKELKDELVEEVKLIDTIVVDPLLDIKKHMDPLKKGLKRRDNKKLDYERFLKDVEHMRKKRNRTDRDNTALAKAEASLEAATVAYHNEDEKLLEWAPPIVERVKQAVSLVLESLIAAQVSLLARSYTVLLEYNQEFGYEQSDQLVEDWEELFAPVKRQVEENIQIVRTGKAVKMPMGQLVPSKSIIPLPGKLKRGAPPPPPSQPSSSPAAKPLIGRVSSASSDTTATQRAPVVPASSRPGLTGRASTSNLSSHYAQNSIRDNFPPPPLPRDKPPPPVEGLRPQENQRTQKSFSHLSANEGSQRPNANRVVSSGSHLSVHSVKSAQEKPEWARLRPTSSSSRYSANSEGPAPTESSKTSYEDARSQSGNHEKPPPSYSAATGVKLNSAIEQSLVSQLNSRPPLRSTSAYSTNSVTSTGSMASAIAAKKKPPPPPPKPKPKQFDNSIYVTAIYTFQGQASGDLSFKEGDRIKVLRKTENMDDWWEGEVDGRRGEFPANYTILVQK